jgi:signal transduction histidine kinase
VVGANLQTSKVPRLAEIPLSPALPHWQLAVIRGNAPKGNFHLLMMVAAIFCAILIMAIAVSGWLLLRDAGRHRRDAQTKTSFVANVSHELKTPLTTIRLYAEMLSEGRAKDPGKQRHYLEVIVQESQRLARLIGNVLDFGRMEQGRKNYHVTIFDAAAAMSHFVNMHRERLQKSGMEVTLSDNTPCPVTCDQDAFEQTLLNLLDNAIKYAAKGKSISFTAATGDDCVIIKVCDRGPGIPSRQLKRLFQPFYRSDDSMTATQPGCGLGLSISRRLMRDLGGDLHYEAHAGGGACFVITLKSAQGDVSGASRQPES